MKIFFAVALILSLSLSSALLVSEKEAEAGILVGVLCFDKGDTGWIPGCFTQEFLGVFVGGTGVVTGLVGLLASSSATAIAGGAILVLDADGSISGDRLAQDISTRYPFIDNTDVTNSIAQAIKAKYASRENKSGVMVSFSPTETSDLLVRADLSEENINHVINDLR